MNLLEQTQVKPEADHFVTVPDTTLPSGIVVPSYQVGRYACTKGIGGKAAVSATDEPWVSITYYEAVDACKKAGYKLITEKQWLALAWNVSQQDCNWSGGKVGKGKLFSGISNWNVNHAQSGTFEPEDQDEHRWLTISNGERIFDINGDVYQWVFDDVQGDNKGIISRKFAKNSITLTTPPYPSEEKGMGKYDVWEWSGYAIYRGGCWNSGSWAGVFSLDVDSPDIRDPGIGFRCTK
jgi:formylglycine-generating enzyme required for sulfatase activity